MGVPLPFLFSGGIPESTQHLRVHRLKISGALLETRPRHRLWRNPGPRPMGPDT